MYSQEKSAPPYSDLTASAPGAVTFSPPPVAPYPQPSMGYQPMTQPFIPPGQYPGQYPMPVMDPALGQAYYQPQQQQYSSPYGSAPPPYATTQPLPGQAAVGSGWNNAPANFTGPAGGSGLAILAQVDGLKLTQKVDLVEAVIGFEKNNKYEVMTSSGAVVFNAKEQTDCCSRQFLGNIRAFEMTLTEPSGAEIIHFSRPLACQSCCFPCCLQEMEIQSPPGSIVATIKQEWTFLASKFSVFDSTGTKIFQIDGPVCPVSCFGSDVDFKVLATNGSEVASIKKKWSGFARELLTDCDSFCVNFPADLDVRMKAALLGATFLIDFMFFEKSANE